MKIGHDYLAGQIEIYPDLYTGYLIGYFITFDKNNLDLCERT